MNILQRNMEIIDDAMTVEKSYNHIFKQTEQPRIKIGNLWIQQKEL